jgi:hypothetical protein
VESVNFSTMNLVYQVNRSVAAAALALDTVRAAVTSSTGQAKDTVAIFDNFFYVLIAAVQDVVPKVQEAVDIGYGKLDASIHAYLTSKDAVTERYLSAFQSVASACNSSSSEPEHDETRPKGFNFNIFGLLRQRTATASSRFEVAKLAISAANDSATELANRLSEVNGSAMGQVVGVFDFINSSLMSLKDADLASALAELNGKVPAFSLQIVTQHVTEAVSNLFKLVDFIKAPVEMSSTRIAQQIQSANSQQELCGIARNLVAVTESARQMDDQAAKIEVVDSEMIGVKRTE